MRMNFDSQAENMQEFGKVSVVPIAHKYEVTTIKLCFVFLSLTSFPEGRSHSLFSISGKMFIGFSKIKLIIISYFTILFSFLFVGLIKTCFLTFICKRFMTINNFLYNSISTNHIHVPNL